MTDAAPAASVKQLAKQRDGADVPASQFDCFISFQSSVGKTKVGGTDLPPRSSNAQISGVSRESPSFRPMISEWMVP